MRVKITLDFLSKHAALHPVLMNSCCGPCVRAFVVFLFITFVFAFLFFFFKTTASR